MQRGFDAVGDGVAVVEEAAEVGFFFVGGDDLRFHANRFAHDLVDVEMGLREHVE